MAVDLLRRGLHLEGVGIVLAAGAMSVKAALFTGDRLSTTTEALDRLS